MLRSYNECVCLYFRIDLSRVYNIIPVLLNTGATSEQCLEGETTKLLSLVERINVRFLNRLNWFISDFW